MMHGAEELRKRSLLVRHWRVKREHAAMLEALRDIERTADVYCRDSAEHNPGATIGLEYDIRDKARAVLATIDSNALGQQVDTHA